MCHSTSTNITCAHKHYIHIITSNSNIISYIFYLLQYFYNVVAKIPIKNPSIFPIADILPLYNLFDSGINSPETIYSIAPAAKLKQPAITCSDIPPTIAPKRAPIPVVTPDNIT